MQRKLENTYMERGRGGRESWGSERRKERQICKDEERRLDRKLER